MTLIGLYISPDCRERRPFRINMLRADFRPRGAHEARAHVRPPHREIPMPDASAFIAEIEVVFASPSFGWLVSRFGIDPACALDAILRRA
jgi:hypothetical protein